MKRIETVDNTAEREAVGRVLELCGILKLKPEDLGLRRGGPDKEYQLTYVTCRIFEDAFKDPRLNRTAQPTA